MKALEKQSDEIISIKEGHIDTSSPLLLISAELVINV